MPNQPKYSNMNPEQLASYYGALAIRVGSNAFRATLDGDAQRAGELAKNAAKFAFSGFPHLRDEW